jgi:hypothetical protein
VITRFFNTFLVRHIEQKTLFLGLDAAIPGSSIATKLPRIFLAPVFPFSTGSRTLFQRSFL